MDSASSVLQLYVTKSEADFQLPWNTVPWTATGTGFLIDADGHLLTCYHCVRHAIDCQASSPLTGSLRYPVTIVSVCPEADLAILRIDAKGTALQKKLRPLPLGDARKLKAGVSTVAMGYPYGQEQVTQSKGVFSGWQGDAMQTDTPINPGSSGGPLVINGKAFGVNASGVVTGGGGASGIGFAIPTLMVNVIWDRGFEKAPARVWRPCLGVVGCVTSP